MRVISVKYFWLRNGLVNCQDVTCSLLLFALLCLQCLFLSPKNPNDEPSKSASNSLLPKILQTSPNSSQSPSKNPPKTLPKPSQIDSKSILRDSWSPSWTHARKKLDLEHPKHGQEAPKSAQETSKTAPNPSQMELKTLPNLIKHFEGI